MRPTRFPQLAALCVALWCAAGVARAQDISRTAPVPLPAGLKTPLLKRVTLEKPVTGKLEDVVKKLAEDNKLKLEIDPAVLKDLQGKPVGTGAVKDVRLDLLLSSVFNQVQGFGVSGSPFATVRNGTLVITNIQGAQARLMNGALVAYVLRQPPDATHAKQVKAAQAQLSKKLDAAADAQLPLLEVLADAQKKHGLTFVFDRDSFGANGAPDAIERKTTVRAKKGDTVESMLRAALNSVDGGLYLDQYGRLLIVHKETLRFLVPKN